MVGRIGLVTVLGALACLAACSGGGSEESAERALAPLEPEEPAADVDVDVEIPTATYTYDDTKGDPSVPPELGGPGFTGEGWTTRMEISSLGNPDAPKGGEIVMRTPDWPATLRMAGKDWNSTLNSHIGSLVYDTLLSLDPVTLEFVPHLATHWQIAEDGSKYRFRLNPEARWSDGKPVVAEDVVASYRLRMDPTLLEPSNQLVFGKMKEPKALSRYMVEVEVKDPNWRNILYFSGALVFPAHEIGELSGKEYLDKYQFAFTAVSGPYKVDAEDIVTNQSITVTRRDDWWGEGNPAWRGMYNFDRIKYVVVKDENLAFEKVKKGEIDYYPIPRAEWYVQDLPEVDAVERGLLVRRKFFTAEPVGYSGIAVNMTRPPLDDLRIRRALQKLLARDTLIEKLFYGEYKPLVSYYQNTPYQNPSNEVYAYDEVGAVELLEEAGYTTINDEGYREKDGKELQFTLSYRAKSFGRILTPFQEACKRAGIRIDLDLVTPATGWKNIREKQYDLSMQAWAMLLFPNPETSWHSSLADQKNNNNVTGFADPRVDKLLKAYDEEYDVGRRVEIIQQIDGILYAEQPYILSWYNPAERVVFWNKYGTPEPWGSQRYAHRSSRRHLTKYWWYDEGKAETLAAAMDDPTKSMDPGPTEVRFWHEWADAQRASEAEASADEPVDAPVEAPAEGDAENR